jgi:acetylornithine/succinyldiaminopimelate/putrescine aminotransferase
LLTVPLLPNAWQRYTFLADETAMYGLALIVERMLGLDIWCVGESEPYIDLVQGYSTTLLGHCHPVIVDTVRHRIGDFDMMHSLATFEKLRLAELLAAHVPVPSPRFHFTAGGAEAVGYALRIARYATGRSRVACLKEGFHGLNADCLPLSEGYVSDEAQWFRAGEATALEADSQAAEQSIRSGVFAAAIVEPVQGAAGWRTIDRDWLRRIEAACRESGTLFIVDEIQCGLGRCGSLILSQTLGLRPDVLLLGKALAGGAYPLGALIVSDDLAARVPAKDFGIGSTFANSALGCAIALEVMSWLLLSGILSSVNVRGERLATALRQRVDARGLLGIRNVGLGIALDFFEAQDARSFVAAALKNHVLLYAAGVRGNVVKLAPPLVIEDVQIAAIAQRLEAAGKEAAEEVSR